MPGPYKKMSNIHNLSTSSTLSSLRSSTPGPFKKTPKLTSTQPKEIGPMRAPHTMESLRREYPEVFIDSQLQDPKLTSPPETCYTCGFKLDRQTSEVGEKVTRCTRCNECDIHESCYKTCRTCEDLKLI